MPDAEGISNKKKVANSKRVRNFFAFAACRKLLKLIAP